VVSPLLALMRDQLSRLPPGLPGAMLQGSMTRQEVEEVSCRLHCCQQPSDDTWISLLRRLLRVEAVLSSSSLQCL